MRVIGVVTTSRADYGIYKPILRAIAADADLDLRLLVSGTHLSPEFGLTVRDIEVDGFHIAERVEMLLSSDTAEGVAKGMGLGLLGFAQIFQRWRPGILVVLGDRFEMHAAALAALPFLIPVAHIHGGELSAGAIDDSLRHSMTKLSHVHFVATEEYAKRVIQLGEEPWRVTVSGAPSLDNLNEIELLDRGELAAFTGIPAQGRFLLVTFHPATLEPNHSRDQSENLVSALQDTSLPVLITMPNADAGGRAVREVLQSFADRCERVHVVENLGITGYFSAMAQAAAMVGNSSSGLVEAASFALPVVNIGSRQAGRVRGRNVLDVGNSSSEIIAGIKRALDPSFRATFQGLPNPYGEGRAAQIITARLRDVELGSALVCKHFHDMKSATSRS